MANAFVWKPTSTGGLNPGGLSVVLGGTGYKGVSLYTAEGKKIEDLLYNSHGTPEPGKSPAMKFYSKKPGASYGQGVIARVTYGDGRTEDYPIENSSAYYRGDLGSPGSLKASADPILAGGGLGAFAPGQIGNFGFFPGYLGGMFPNPSLVNPTAGKAKFTDPIKFGKKYGEFARTEMGKNFSLSQDFALKSLDTELQGLKNYVPAASALKRSETSADNIFNQNERTLQVNRALPGVGQQLGEQGQRAETYASGRVPDSVTDRALELNIRSGAADRAGAGGFGASSSASRKSSDLMSAEQRIALSQYGDQLLTSNIGTKANLFLAPTEYSDAGSQVRVMPSLSASQLTQDNFGQLNSNTILPISTAFTGTVQQNQFNAGQALNTAEYNASAQNSFALQKFGYNASYAGTVAGAAQTNANTEFALQQQQQAQDIYSDFLKNTQKAGQTGAIAQGVAAVLPSLINAGSQLIGALIPQQTQQQPASIAPTQISTGGGSLSSGQISSIETGAPATPSGGPSGAVTIPSGSSVPSGFTGVASSTDGGTIAIPDSTINSRMQNFSESTGIPSRMLAMSSTPDIAGMSGSGGYGGGGAGGSDTYTPSNLLTASQGVLRAAGIHEVPVLNGQSIGNSVEGKPLYSPTALVQSDDTLQGSHFVNGIAGVLDPLNVFSKEDSSKMNQLATVAGDASLIASLTAQYQSGNTKGFINTMLSAVQQPVIESITSNKQNQSGLSSAFNAYQLYQNWGQMSPAQKALGVAAVGIQGYKFASGENLASKTIIAKTPVSPELNVGQALNLFSAGYNVYSLVKNWSQMNNLQKVAVGTGSVAQIAELAKSMNMLGAGVQGAEVAGVTAESLAASGFTQAPQLGVGAIVGKSASAMPNGFSVVAQNADGTIVATPTGTLSSAQGVTASGNLLGTAAGVAGIGAGAYAVYKGWGAGGTKGAINGALGGSAMASGLYTLGVSNPYTLAAVVAASVVADSIHVGKSDDQKSRDTVRSVFQKNGLSNSQYKVTLADGTQADIGIDGHGGQHEVTNKDLLTNEHKNIGKLNSWDIDYTNDLDYAAGMGGIALSRLINGGTGKAVDQLGNQLGNAALTNVGYNKEMNQETYGKTMQNMRAVYSQAGIKSKSDAFQLANQMYAEKRIDDTQLVSMHQAFNMIFDNNSIGTAQKLMVGRQQGIKVASETANKVTPVDRSPNAYDNKIKAPVNYPQKAPNKLYSMPEPTNKSDATISSKGLSIKDVENSNKKHYSSLSKDEIKLRNKQKYQQQQAGA